LTNQDSVIVQKVHLTDVGLNKKIPTKKDENP